MSVDWAGDVYITDTNNSLIEEVTPTGTLSVVVGTGTAGTPVAGPPRSSSLNDPYATATDRQGQLFIADSQNNVVEEVTGVVAVAPPPGYWLTASDGGVFAYGAPFEGSHGGSPLNKPIVGMASTPDGKGYWLVASDGGIFGYGDAVFYGGHGGSPLNKPIVGMASTPDGKGYWLVASDGGIFSYGDAGVLRRSRRLAPQPAHRGHGLHPGRRGLLAGGSDGGIFSYGDAVYYGSRRRRPSTSPSWAWPPPRTAGATGWWLRRRHLQPTGTRCSPVPRGLAPQPAHRGHGLHPGRRGLLVGGIRRRHLLPTETPCSRDPMAAPP